MRPDEGKREKERERDGERKRERDGERDFSLRIHSFAYVSCVSMYQCRPSVLELFWISFEMYQETCKLPPKTLSSSSPQYALIGWTSSEVLSNWLRQQLLVEIGRAHV